MTVKNNLAGMVSLGALGAVAIKRSGSAATLPALVGGGFGAAIGLLQSRSTAINPQDFQRAATWIDLREALQSNAPGRTSINLHWAGTLLTVAAAARSKALFGGTVAGWALLGCLRNAAVLKALSDLSKEPGHDPEPLPIFPSAPEGYVP